ncbi:hypothetical protein CROQUDRAFT_104795 [Cronartium quercuum f. sp. fusiforme G11]|uniref:DDE Tnp4 domain-containing protein n=1 Tax=Cronartium quercuum f. sp. fusiforme G11 TaxID=708437 RepID=A0A9P6NMI3_9BASI|nr:hypothetical protein CROQUDRAFT_104795 [Cronartium quercuum f. sp. fusiforme G11]
MPQVSLHTQILRELPTIAAFVANNALEELLMPPTQRLPSLGAILFPHTPKMTQMYNQLFNEEEELVELLTMVSTTRYLAPRFKLHWETPFQLGDMLRDRNTEFRQAVRTIPTGFRALLDLIADHPVFISASPNQPPPVVHQLALTLERLGTNGNGASIGRFGRMYKMSRGCVITSTRRVLIAILDRGKDYVSWPSPERRHKSSNVLAREGFPHCVGFVKGATFPIYQRPGLHGETFYDRKSRYSINAQIVCDCDRRITAVYAGWPGSCADVTVFGKMSVAKNAERFFGAATNTVTRSYKAQAANNERVRDFNYYVAKTRVRNEHSIGVLKGRWPSLECMRLHLYGRTHMHAYSQWIRACVILSNIFAGLEDAWTELFEEEVEQEPVILTNVVAAEMGLLRCEVVGDYAVASN